MTATCDGDEVLWFGLIESQLRHLKDNLEREYGVIEAHIWPVAFTREEISPFTRMWFLAADIHPAYDVAGETGRLRGAVGSQCRQIPPGYQRPSYYSRGNSKD